MFWWILVTAVLLVVMWVVSTRTLRRMQNKETPRSNPEHF